MPLEEEIIFGNRLKLTFSRKSTGLPGESIRKALLRITFLSRRCGNLWGAAILIRGFLPGQAQQFVNQNYGHRRHRHYSQKLAKTWYYFLKRENVENCQTDNYGGYQNKKRRTKDQSSLKHGALLQGQVAGQGSDTVWE
jgi:hypothetical protein